MASNLKPTHHVDEWWECPVCNQYKFQSAEEVERGLKFVPQSPFKVGDKVRHKNGEPEGRVSDIRIYCLGDRAAHKHVLRITVDSPSGGGRSMFYIYEDKDESKQLELDD